LLEAIRILVTDGDLNVLANILEYREEGAPSDYDADEYEIFPALNFFYGFPELSDCNQSVNISAQNYDKDSSIHFQIGWYRREEEVESGMKLSPVNMNLDLFGDPDAEPYLEIKPSNGKERKFNLQHFIRWARRPESIKTSNLRCIYVDPFSSRPTHKLADLWDSIVLKEPEKKVIEGLQIIADDIEDITMVSDSSYRHRVPQRKAIAKSKKYAKPIPLRSFGDGLNRWLGILISLASAGKGFLLIDEVETGIHYSVQKDLWKAIFKLASDLDVQVFATTHSWDCVEAFQEAASQSPEEGVLIRLSEKDGKMFSTHFSEEELQVVTRDNIEIR